jgi:hypothetical protein
MYMTTSGTTTLLMKDALATISSSEPPRASLMSDDRLYFSSTVAWRLKGRDFSPSHSFTSSYFR